MRRSIRTRGLVPTLRLSYNPAMDVSPETPEQTLVRLDRITRLIDELAKARGDFAEQQDLADRLRRELAATRQALQPFIKNIPPV